MGAANSTAYNNSKRKSGLQDWHSKSNPNIRNYGDTCEAFYFDQALKLQEQFSLEKHIRFQQEFNCPDETLLRPNNFNLFKFNEAARLKSGPIDSNHCCHELNNIKANQDFFYMNTTTLRSNASAITEQFADCTSDLKATKRNKKPKMFKIKNSSSNSNGNAMNESRLNLRPSLDQSAAQMTKSLVMFDSRHEATFRKRSLKRDEHENRASIGNRLSSMTGFVGIRESLKSNSTHLSSDFNAQLSSIELNKSIDLNESSLASNDPSRLRSFYLNTKNFVLNNNSNNSSSSGCSSAASSSNLSITRRLNHKKPSLSSRRPESSVSNWSATKTSTPSPVQPLGSSNNVSNEAPPPHLRNYSYLNGLHGAVCRQPPVEPAVLANSSSDQKSVSSMDERKLNTQPSVAVLDYAGSVKLAKRAQNRLDKTKSESMYVQKSRSVVVDEQQQQQVKKGKKLRKKSRQRDSGILVDLFHLNGSVNNLRAKLSSATTSLRNSLSVFNLKNHHQTSKKSKSPPPSQLVPPPPPILGDKPKHNDESDFDIDNSYENDENFNTHSEDDYFNEFASKARSDTAFNSSSAAKTKTVKTMTTTCDCEKNSTLSSLSQSLINDKLSTPSRLDNSQLLDTKSFASSTSIPTDNNNNINNINKLTKALDTCNANININNNNNNKSDEINDLKQFLDEISNLKISNSNNKSLDMKELVEPSAVAVGMSSFKAPTASLAPLKLPNSISFNSNMPKAKPEPVAQPTHKKIVVQASTSDLLNCFAQFIAQRCAHLSRETYINPLCYMNNDIGKKIKFEPRDTINWLRSADRALLVQGWQEIAFMNPVNVVFVYLLVRDTLKSSESVKTVYHLQCNIMACLYLAFSYMGNEISYPLKPFLIEENRSIFWQRTCDLMNKLSANMLRINRDPRYFTELFYELKSYSLVIKKSNTSSSFTSQIIQNPKLKTDVASSGGSSSNGSCRNLTFKNAPHVSEQQDEKHVPSLMGSACSQKKQPQSNQKYLNFSSHNLNRLDSAASTGLLTISNEIFKQTEIKKPQAAQCAAKQQKPNGFYGFNEQPRVNHQVLFSSNEQPPITYCI